MSKFPVSNGQFISFRVRLLIGLHAIVAWNRAVQMMEEMRCDQFYFYDTNVRSCISCEDTCNPYRQATEIECQIHCSAYLHWRNQFTAADDHATADNQELSATNSSQLSLTMVLILAVSGFFGICVFVICSVWLIYRFRRRPRRKGKRMGKSGKTDFEVECFNIADVQKSLSEPSKFVSSSLCQETDSLSIPKSPDILIESSPRSVFIPSTGTFKMISQETQAEGSHMPSTRPKETDSASVTIQHQNESTTSPIDLHEDFDCVEQTYDLAQRGHNADVVLSHFSCDNDGMKNLRISAVLQRLAWVKQFWWDVEGAKVVVDRSRQMTAKEDIKNILQREGIPSSEFNFQLVSPPSIFLLNSGSTDSESNG